MGKRTKVSKRVDEELERIYQTAPVGLCLVDRELRFRRVNKRLALINGRSVEQHIGRTVHEVIPQIADQVEARYRRVLETGRPILDVEVTGCLPSDPGSEHTWLVSDHPYLSAEGEVDGIVTVVLDITDRKRIERELREMRERLVEAERVAEFASWEWNLETGDVWWSQEMYGIFGQRDAAFQPSFDAMIELVHPDDRRTLREQLDAVFDEAGVRTVDYRVLRDGAERVIQSTAKLKRDAAGKPARLIATAQDITDQSNSRAELSRERDHLARMAEDRTHEADWLRDRLRQRTGVDPKPRRDR